MTGILLLFVSFVPFLLSLVLCPKSFSTLTVFVLHISCCNLLHCSCLHESRWKQIRECGVLLLVYHLLYVWSYHINSLLWCAHLYWDSDIHCAKYCFCFKSVVVLCSGIATQDHGHVCCLRLVVSHRTVTSLVKSLNYHIIIAQISLPVPCQWIRSKMFSLQSNTDLSQHLTQTQHFGLGKVCTGHTRCAMFSWLLLCQLSLDK